MKKAGLDISAIGRLRNVLSEVPDEDETQKRTLVRDYLSAPTQVAARERSTDEQEFAKDIADALAGFVSGWIKDGGDPAKVEGAIKQLLGQARKHPVAYERAKTTIAELLDADMQSGQVLRFIADDYSGKVQPKASTRSMKPKNYFRQMQAVACVSALKASGVSERKSFAIVAEISSSLGIAWPATYGAREPSVSVTTEQIRNAYRNGKFAKYPWGQ